jgi:hypothetical protein
MYSPWERRQESCPQARKKIQISSHLTAARPQIPSRLGFQKIGTKIKPSSGICRSGAGVFARAESSTVPGRALFQQNQR